MTGLIGIILICWGFKSLFRINKRKRSLIKSKRWAESIINSIENIYIKDCKH